ncbi:MAG: Fic family protein [Solirubrobacterales bacterium]
MATENSQKSLLQSLEYEKHHWVPSENYAGRNAIRKHTGPYWAAIPASIANLDPVANLSSEVLSDADEATQQLVRFDEFVAREWGTDSPEPAPMASVLLRTESASSSQIENLTVGARQLALAELGELASTNARLVTANVHALAAATNLAESVSTETILDMHRHLLESVDPDAGKLRHQQVWIGGSGIGPHLADFIPPFHERLPGAMEDLVAFCQRVDVPSLAQIAIAHAQFETIHPFTDGNGRTGRALVQAMMKGSDLTKRTTVPLSAGLLVDVDRYFDSLTAYREGDAAPILSEFNRAAQYAATEGRGLVRDLEMLRNESASRVKARTDSAVWRLNDLLISQPVVNTAFVSDSLGISKVAAQTSIDKLVDAGTLKESTKKVRNRVWQAIEILARLDEFAAQHRRPPGNS